jgi:WD40 repeat protein/energy-coupling factor transporter ATP-binding protein EcfA2
MNKPRQHNPFVGLRPFEREDSLYYFGRDGQTKALLQHLHQCRFLAVVGSSGCGKSSLVRAGLIPHLQAGFLVRDRDTWLIATMKPGDGPLRNLAAALLGIRNSNPTREQIEEFREELCDGGASAIVTGLQAVIEEADGNLLLVVDQFEELFRFGLDAKQPERHEEAIDFVAILLALAQQRDMPVYVCITMRSDFVGECDAFFGLPEAMNRGQYLAPRLTRSQRLEAIVGPINLAGAKIAPRLVDRLLNENMETRDDLPLLQHALMRTWTTWEDGGAVGSLDIQHYEAIGTVANALDRHAEAALDALPEVDKPIAKRLFQTLTETDQGNRTVRKPTTLRDIAAIAGVSPEKVIAVINQFRADERNFLVLSSDSANPLVDISHESLIRQWKTLTEWVSEEAESARHYQRLVDSAKLNQQGKARLYSDPDLQLALDWRANLLQARPMNSLEVWARHYHGDFQLVMQFLDASQEADRQAKAEEWERQLEKERLLHEKAEAIQQKAEQQQQALRRSRIYSGIIAFFLVLAIGAAGFAFNQNNQAQIQKRIAESKSVQAQEQKQNAEYNLSKVFETRALKLLLDKNHPDIEYSENTQNESTRNAWIYIAAALNLDIPPTKQALSLKALGTLLTDPSLHPESADFWIPRSHQFTDGAWVDCVIFSPDGRQLVTTGFSARLWDVVSGKTIHILEEKGGGGGGCVSFSPDGKRLATTALYGNTINLRDVATGNILSTLGGQKWGSIIAFSPDGKQLAAGGEDKVRLWEVDSRKLIFTQEQKGWFTGIAFSPDGRQLATSSNQDKTVRLWDVATGATVAKLEGHEGPINGIAFNPYGKWLATASADKTARLWEVNSGKALYTLKHHTEPVTSIVFSPDGKQLATASEDKTVCVWEVDSGNLLFTLEGHAGAVTSIAFSPDGKQLATASDDQTIRLWDMASGKTVQTLEGKTGKVKRVAFSPDGKLLASSSYLAPPTPRIGESYLPSSFGSTVRLWDINTGTILAEPGDGKSPATNVASKSEAGQPDKVATNKPVNHEVSAKEGIVKLEGLDGVEITASTFSPDGKQLATASKDQTIRLWDVATGKQLAKTNLVGKWIRLSFSPNGKQLVLSFVDHNANVVTLWDIGSDQPPTKLKDDQSLFSRIAFSPDGKLLALRSGDSFVLWDVSTGKRINTLNQQKGVEVTSAVFSHDGKRLATGHSDKKVLLWSMDSGNLSLIHTLSGHEDLVYSMTFSPDGKRLATGSVDNTMRLWEVDSGKALYTLNDFMGIVNDVVFSPDGKQLVTVSMDNHNKGTVSLWEVDTGKNLQTFNIPSECNPYGIVSSPDGKTLASTSNKLCLWDADSGKTLAILDGILSFAFKPDGKQLDLGTKDNRIQVLDLTYLPRLLELENDRKLASLFEEALIFLWQRKLDPETGQIVPLPRQPTIKPQGDYFFEYEPKFRPLLDPPKPGQTQFDQIIEWARQEEHKTPSKID